MLYETRRYQGTAEGRDRREGWSQRCTLYYCQAHGQSPPSIQHQIHLFVFITYNHIPLCWEILRHSWQVSAYLSPSETLSLTIRGGWRSWVMKLLPSWACTLQQTWQNKNWYFKVAREYLGNKFSSKVDTKTSDLVSTWKIFWQLIRIFQFPMEWQSWALGVGRIMLGDAVSVSSVWAGTVTRLQRVPGDETEGCWSIFEG